MPKAKLAGLTATAKTPVPLNVTTGLLLALSLMFSTAERRPAAAGANETETLQLAPPPSVAGESGQVVVLVKSGRVEVMELILNGVL